MNKVMYRSLLLPLFLSGIAFCSTKLSFVEKDDKCILSNGYYSVTLIPSQNYIINSFCDPKGKNLLTLLALVPDMIGTESDLKADEMHAKRKKINVEHGERAIKLTVTWQNQFMEVTKTITAKADCPDLEIHYSVYILKKMKLRFMAVPLMVFPEDVMSFTYENRLGQIKTSSARKLQTAKFGKFSAVRPGSWYATSFGNSTGLLVTLPRLVSDYGLFNWPPEWGRDKQLVSSFNVGTAGLCFPHYQAGMSPDTRFNATVILTPIKGSINKEVQAAAARIGLEAIKFSSLPRNDSAKLIFKSASLAIWTDNSSGSHQQNEKLSQDDSVQSVTFAAARNQYISSQLIFNASDELDLEQIKVEIPNVKSDVRLMGYVKLSKPGPVDKKTDPQCYPTYWPDPLLPFAEKKLPPNLNHAVLLTLYVPPTTSPGKYQGSVEIKFRNKNDKIILPLVLRIFDFELPSPRTFKNISDIKDTAIAAGRGLPGRPGIDARKLSVQMSYAELFAEHNMSGHYSHYVMAREVLEKMSHKWSAPALPTEQAYLVFEGKFWTYYINGKPVTPEHGVITELYKKAIIDTYRQNIKQMRQGGIKGPIYAVVADDALLEPHLRKFVLSMIPELKKLDDDLLIVACTKSNFDEELAEYIDIPITAVALDSDTSALLKRLKEKGKIREWWICINSWTKIDEPPACLRAIFWGMPDEDISGTWNWDAVDFWWLTEDIYKNPTLLNWWGEGYLAYPGIPPRQQYPCPSLRMVQIRMGIDDYEYLNILTQLVHQHKIPIPLELSKRLLYIAKEVFKDTSTDAVSSDMLEQLRIDIASFIEKIKSEKHQIDYQWFDEA